MSEIYTIYTEKLAEVEKKLKNIERKALRYGVPFNYEVTNPHTEKVTSMGVDPVTQRAYIKYSFKADAVDIVLNCDDFIKANGWTVIAKLEHGDQGNIVYTFGECTEDEWKAWSVAPAKCDHCGTNRHRKATYIVRHEDGRTKQVGKGCLKDYTGINPATATAWAEVDAILEDGLQWYGSYSESNGFTIPVIEVLAAAIQSTNDKGYVKSAEINSTKSDVCKLLRTGFTPTDKIKAEAEALANWIAETEHDPMSVEANCKTLVKSGFCKISHVGLLAYMPTAYARSQKRKEVKAKAVEAANRSEYIGTVGERITFKAVTAKLLTSWENSFGYTYLYKFTDENENSLVWFASSAKEIENGATIKGTVKAHNERNNEKQTVITRCKVM